MNASNFVAQICNLPSRRFVIGRTFERPSVLVLGDELQNTLLRCSAAWTGRNQIVFVVVLVLAFDQFNSIHDDEEEDEDEKFARPATISRDTDRLQICARRPHA